MMISNFRVAWLLSYISIASFSAAIITPALPEIQIQFALQNGQVKWIVSAFLMGYVVGQLIYGPLANRWGRVFALRVGLSINLLGIVVCLVALAYHSYFLLVSGRLITALGAASGLACTFMLINEWLPEAQRKTAMAYTILSFTLGIGLAVSLGGLITEYGQWPFCFLLLLFQAVIMLAGTRMFKETLEIAQPFKIATIWVNYRQALQSGELVLYALVVGFCSVIGYCFAAAGPQIASDLLHLNPAEYGYWNLINMMGMLAGGLWSKSLLNQMTAGKVIMIGFVGCLLALLSLSELLWSGSPSSVWFFLSTLGLYLFSGLLFAGGSLISSNALADKASGSAMMSFINMSTAALAVVVMGYLGTNPLKAFVEILSWTWFLLVALLIGRYYLLKFAKATSS